MVNSDWIVYFNAGDNCECYPNIYFIKIPVSMIGVNEWDNVDMYIIF